VIPLHRASHKKDKTGAARAKAYRQRKRQEFKPATAAEVEPPSEGFMPPGSCRLKAQSQNRPRCRRPSRYRARNRVERFFNRIKQCRRMRRATTSLPPITLLLSSLHPSDYPKAARAPLPRPPLELKLAAPQTFRASVSPAIKVVGRHSSAVCHPHVIV
jgi:hypothetical protein